VRTLIEGGRFYEGPRWRDGAWWVSDVYGGQVLRVTPDGAQTVVAEVPGQPSGLGWLPDGDLLIVSMQDRLLLRRPGDGRLVVHADLTSLTDFPVNDMVVDRLGRAYIGSFGFDMWSGAAPAPGTLIRVDPDGAAQIVASDLMFPNGMVITVDQKTLVVAESLGGCLTAFSIGPDGALTGRRAWAAFGKRPELRSMDDVQGLGVAPDGCAIDAENRVWMADAMNNRVCRVADGGEILQEVRGLENGGIYSCALGGEDGRTLLMCAAPDFHKAQRQDRREAALLLVAVSVESAPQ
jgi:sugar lactone lactonase YvrE